MKLMANSEPIAVRREAEIVICDSLPAKLLRFRLKHLCCGFR
jgi:hypothetical protein